MPLSMAAPAIAAPPACFPMAARLPLPDAAAPVAAKHKAIVVLGATGTGTSRLAIDLALRFNGEVINSDKIQAYAGLDVATNKVGPAERAGVPHHLLGVVHPDAEFTAADFRREAAHAAAAATARGRVPIIAGGSNSYVEGDRRAFLERYECCFLWVDAQLPVLHDFVARRVDRMCRHGLVNEVAAAFDPRRTDYSRGIWRAIGVSELDTYLRARGLGDVSDEQRARMLAAAVDEIKANTSLLALRQRGKIQRLARMWRVRRVDATEVFLKRGHAAGEAWQRLVAAPCIDAVRSFLLEDQEYMREVDVKRQLETHVDDETKVEQKAQSCERRIRECTWVYQSLKPLFFQVIYGNDITTDQLEQRKTIWPNYTLKALLFSCTMLFSAFMNLSSSTPVAIKILFVVDIVTFFIIDGVLYINLPSWGNALVCTSWFLLELATCILILPFNQYYAFSILTVLFLIVVVARFQPKLQQVVKKYVLPSTTIDADTQEHENHYLNHLFDISNGIATCGGLATGIMGYYSYMEGPVTAAGFFFFSTVLLGLYLMMVIAMRAVSRAHAACLAIVLKVLLLVTIITASISFVHHSVTNP